MINVGYRAKVVYQKKEVAQQYDKKRFSTFFGKFIDHLEKKAALKLIGKKVKGRVIIDIPCGTGRMIEMLSNNAYYDNCYIVGADISSNMLFAARKRLSKNKNIDFVRCDIEKPPFRDDVSECTLVVRFMGHVPPDIRIKVLRELKRVTLGRVIVSYRSSVSIMTIINKIRWYAKKIKTYHFLLTPGSLKTEINKSGLCIRRMRWILDRKSVV